MNEDFVTYEQAVKLKELGFNYKCNHLYSIENPNNIIRTSNYHNKAVITDTILAPTLSQVQKWLREVKGISIEPISCGFDDNDNAVWSSFICLLKSKKENNQTALFKSYEQALSEAIDKALEILKQ